MATSSPLNPLPANRAKVRASSSLLLISSAALFALLVGIVLFQYALPGPELILAGQLSDFPASPEPYELHTEQFIFLVNMGSELLAFDNRTPRIPGCWVGWSQERARFLDPCLGTQFARDGSYIDGPPSPPMGRYEVRVEGSQVWIDVSKLIRTTPVP